METLCRDEKHCGFVFEVTSSRTALPAAPGETAAEAIAVLDPQFHWLRGAGRVAPGT
jgi:hypothetical protein